MERSIGTLKRGYHFSRMRYLGLKKENMVISDRVVSVILAHNHPSGVLKPSPEDITMNQRLIHAGKILGITVLDQIIIPKKGYLSFKEAGLI